MAVSVFCRNFLSPSWVQCMLHFIHTSVGTSHKSNACSMFALQACLHMAPPATPTQNRSNRYENSSSSCDITTKVVVRQIILHVIHTLVVMNYCCFHICSTYFVWGLGVEPCLQCEHGTCIAFM